MEKKWFASKKFISIIAGVIATLLNKYLELGLSMEEMTLLIGSLITYIFVEAGLDAKRSKGSYHPLQDPAVRDALESLISDGYDFAAARSNGIHAHIQEIKSHVFDGLIHLGISAKILDDSEEFAKEISRIVLKMYREDQKMKEGADLILGRKNG